MIHMGPCGNTNPCCSSTTVPDMASSSNLDLNITMDWGGRAGFLEKLGPSSSMVPRLQMAQVMARFPESHMPLVVTGALEINTDPAAVGAKTQM